MSRYIASNDNRFYTALESNYGVVPAISATHRIPAVRLQVRQAMERVTRRDKTGGRSFLGLPTGIRRNTTYLLKTYLSSWSDQSTPPSYSPLFEAALGATPLLFSGATIAGVENSGGRLQFGGAHGLRTGQALSANGELRFVTAIPDAQRADVSAPFSSLSAGDAIGPTVTYRLSKEIPSVSIFDYWSPDTAVHRILHGAGVDEMKVTVNGDFHEFDFRGPARDVIDSVSFLGDQGGLTSWPDEPAMEAFDYSIIPGHIGQVWLGSAPDRFFSLTEAELKLNNGIETRAREFGMHGLRAITGGDRRVALDFQLFASDEVETKALYEAARYRSPIQVMLQLGQQQGQLFGAYLKSVVPETPRFDDSETRLQWQFSDCRAQGSGDDELTIAFG